MCCAVPRPTAMGEYTSAQATIYRFGLMSAYLRDDNLLLEIGSNGTIVVRV